MILNNVLGGIPAQLFMERYVDEGARSYSPFAARSEVSPEYHPRSDRPYFELIAIRVPKDKVSLFQAEPDKILFDYYVRHDEVLFQIHPETWENKQVEHLDGLQSLCRGEPLHVAPTSSTRTVVTMPCAEISRVHFVKLHYPRRISRFNRRLRQKNIRNSIEISRDMAHISFSKFAYLPESIGMTFSHESNPWGFLVRESNPRPYARNRFLIPCFSLYAGDLKAPNDSPLLVQLIKRLGVEPVSFVVHNIMIPVLECWTKVVRERGILLESHAQNILLEVDQNFAPRRIVHRDFDVWIDGDARRRAGLEVPFEGCISADSPHPRQQHYSLVYDHFIGREFFDYLLNVLVQHYATKKEAVQLLVKEAFHRAFPDSREFFPVDTTYYFSNELLSGNNFILVDTKQPPDWR